MEQKMVHSAAYHHMRHLLQQQQQQQHQNEYLDVDLQQSSPSRPSLGFPLGTALLLILIFTLSGIFSCCYHWDKLRSFRRHQQHPTPSSSKPTPPHMMGKQEMDAVSVTVIMPGDEVPKFIALPCPCQPYHLPQVVVPSRPHNNPKPLIPIPTLTSFPIPLYI